MFLRKLYARSANGKISEWQIEIDGPKYRTISGYTDGLKVTSEYTDCVEKNIGKSNSTTREGQALAEAVAKWDKRRELGYWEDLNDIDNNLYFEPMLAKEYLEYCEEIQWPVATQPKYDGLRSIKRFSGTWSRNGKLFVSTPHIDRELTILFDGMSDLILDGELYADRGSINFDYIISLARKTVDLTLENLAESEKYIKLYVYDIPSHPGTFRERYQYLVDLFEKYPNIKDVCELVPTKLCWTHEEVEKELERLIGEGYEGVMIRNLNAKYQTKRTKDLLKYKRMYSKEYIILGYEEGKGKLKNKVGKLIFKNEEGKVFKCAVNGTHEYLSELWLNKNELVGKEATIKYQELTKDNVPRFGKVICLDRKSFE